MPDHFASVAQSAEREFRKLEVVGAIPTGGSTIYSVNAHQHIIRRLNESEDQQKKRLKEILKELQELSDIQGVGALARDLDDILNVPLAE